MLDTKNLIPELNKVYILQFGNWRSGSSIDCYSLQK